MALFLVFLTLYGLGFFSNQSMPISGTDMEVVDIVFHPTEPHMYLFLNVKGRVNVTQPSGSINQYAPFQGVESYYRALVLQYNSVTLKFETYAQYGAYLPPTSLNDPLADFTIVKALWANDTLWAAYNLGPNKGQPSLATVAFYKNATSNFGVPGTMGNTGILRIELDTLLPNTNLANFPGIFSFSNLTSSTFFFDGNDLHLGGSFTQSPLYVPLIHVDEQLGERGSCDNASRGEGGGENHFQWCPGAEDGWNMALSVAGKNAQIQSPNFIYSQNTGAPSRFVRAISTSSDNENAIYNCYLTNNDYIVTSESGDQNTFLYNSTAFNRSSSTPQDNHEIFCTIHSDSTFSFTSIAFNGETSNMYAVAIPTSHREILSSATINNNHGSIDTVFNISGVQGVGDEMGYRLQTSPGFASITHLTSTPHHEILVSGIFRGQLVGDPVAPIQHVNGGEGSSNSLFVLYYNRSESPTQISPHSVLSMSHSGVDFKSTKSYLHPTSTNSHPIILITSYFTASNFWTYNNTILPPTSPGTTGFFWGLYSPETTTVPGPIFTFPPPQVPSSSPTTTGNPPSSQSPSTPTSEANAIYHSSKAICLILIAVISSFIL
jgi:hypothetical protein